MDMQLHGSSKKQDWGTPTKWFNDLNAVFNFTVDACALPHNAKLPRYWTPEQDGLKQGWFGERVWCNPPYGKELKQWAEKFCSEANFVELAVMLVPARTDTKWFNLLRSNYTTFCFLRGRLKFEDTSPEYAPSVFSYSWFKFRFSCGLLTFRNDDAAPFPPVLVIAGYSNKAQTEYLQSLGILMKEI